MIRILVLMVLVISCNEAKKEENYPVTESEVLNNFVRSAPIQYINLDSVRTIKIVLSEENIVLYQGNLDKESFIGRMTHVIATENAFYAFERSDKKIVRIDFDGLIEKTVALNGRGPGEVLSVSSMDKNAASIFTSDESNSRINIYDYNFNYKNTITSFRVKNFSVNEKYIIYSKSDYQGVKTTGMATIAELSSPQDSITKIMPKVVPDGLQPFVYNRVSFDMNDKNEVAASYDFLPWVSLFNNSFSLERTLILESSDFDKRNLLELKIHPPDPNNKDGIGGQTIVTNFKYFDNGDLFIQDGKSIIFLKKNRDGSYEAVAKYLVDYPDSEETFWVGSFDVFNNRVIKSSNWYYLFQFELIK